MKLKHLATTSLVVLNSCLGGRFEMASETPLSLSDTVVVPPNNSIAEIPPERNSSADHTEMFGEEPAEEGLNTRGYAGDGIVVITVGANKGWSRVNVSIDGRRVGTITQFTVPTLSTGCRSTTRGPGRVVVGVQAGIRHKYSAISDRGYTGAGLGREDRQPWSGYVTVAKGKCKEIMLLCPLLDCSDHLTLLREAVQRAQRACINDPLFGPNPSGFAIAAGAACDQADWAVSDPWNRFCAFAIGRHNNKAYDRPVYTLFLKTPEFLWGTKYC